MVGTASASSHAAPQGDPGTGSCSIRSLPSFVAQGEFNEAATVGDVIEVSCDPFTYGQEQEVTVESFQLYNRCHEISWYIPNQDGYSETSDGPSVRLKLDVDGNANVGLIAGPKCAVGESLVSVDEDASPFETFTTDYTVLPSVNTEQGLFMTPASQVEDAESSAVVTIAQAEFKSASEAKVRIGARQLYDRCERGDKLTFVTENRETSEGSEITGELGLDNNGNGFVLLVGSDSCAEGKSLIEADLESNPFTTLTSEFTVESPRPERFES
jgi:hypothetical protein